MLRVEARNGLKFTGNLENPYQDLSFTCWSQSSFSEKQRKVQNELKKWSGLQKTKKSKSVYQFFNVIII